MATSTIRKRNAHLRRKPGRPPSQLTLAAKELGCSYSHLHAVVKGQRPAPELLQSWHDWLAQRSTAQAS